MTTQFRFPVAGQKQAMYCCCNTCCPKPRTLAQCCCNPGCYPFFITIGGNTQTLLPPDPSGNKCQFTSADGTAVLTYCSQTGKWTLAYGGQTYTVTSSACPPPTIGPATIGCPLGSVVQCEVSGVDGTWWYCNSPYPEQDGGNGTFCSQAFNLDGTVIMNGARATYGSPCGDGIGQCVMTGSALCNSPCNCFNAFYNPATPTCYYQNACIEPTLNAPTGNIQPCAYSGSPVQFALNLCLGHAQLTCPCVGSQTVTWYAAAELLINGIIFCSICLTGTSTWSCDQQTLPLPGGWSETTGCPYGDFPGCWNCPSLFQLQPSMFTFSYQ